MDFAHDQLEHLHMGGRLQARLGISRTGVSSSGCTAR